MNKQLVMALLASGALVGLSGCSEGDEATIVIDAPTTSNSNNTTNNPAPAPAPTAGYGPTPGLPPTAPPAAPAAAAASCQVALLRCAKESWVVCVII